MQRFFSRMPVAGRLMLDTGMLIATIALIDPRASGLAIHEWVGIILGAILFVHLTLNWQWVIAVTKKMFANLPRETRINQILNGLLFIFMAVAIGSGVAISEDALPTFGILTSGSRVWLNVHGLSANASLILIGAHVAMNWHWVIRTVRRIAGTTVRKNPSLRPAQPRGGIIANIPAGAQTDGHVHEMDHPAVCHPRRCDRGVRGYVNRSDGFASPRIAVTGKPQLGTCSRVRRSARQSGADRAFRRCQRPFVTRCNRSLGPTRASQPWWVGGWHHGARHPSHQVGS